MEDPEAYLRALTAPLARAREGSPLPVVRFSLEAVANAFVILGLLPAVRAEEILAAQRPVLGAAGFRVGLAIGELSVSPGSVRLPGGTGRRRWIRPAGPRRDPAVRGGAYGHHRASMADPSGVLLGAVRTTGR